MKNASRVVRSLANGLIWAVGRFGWIHQAVSTLIVVAFLIVVATATSWWILVAVAALLFVALGAGLIVGRRLRAKRAKSPP